MALQNYWQKTVGRRRYALTASSSLHVDNVLLVTASISLLLRHCLCVTWCWHDNGNKNSIEMAKLTTSLLRYPTLRVWTTAGVWTACASAALHVLDADRDVML
jgi:hypothetical protein